MNKRADILKCELLEDIEDLRIRKQRIYEKEKRLNEVATDYAIETAVFKIGERIIRKRSGEEFEVSNIVGSISDIDRPKYYGRKIKKDGGLHKMETDLWYLFGGIGSEYVSKENIDDVSKGE